MLASLLTSCVYDRRAEHHSLAPDVPLSVVISNQCAVVRLPTGYIALGIVKDSPTIYYGAYFSEKNRFGWPRPTADGIVTNSGVITVRGIRVHLSGISARGVHSLSLRGREDVVAAPSIRYGL